MSSYLSSFFLEPVFGQGRARPGRDRANSPSSSATNEGERRSSAGCTSSLSGGESDGYNEDLLDLAGEERLERDQMRARTIPRESVAGQQLLPSPLQNLDTQPSTGNSTLSDREIQLERSRALTFGLSSRHENGPTEMSLDSMNDTGDSPIAPGEGETSGSTLHPVGSISGPTESPHTARDSAEDATVGEFDWGEKSPARLPEDDGKSFLRRRIHAIRETEVSNAEKARLVHEVMTEEYNSSQHLLPLEARSPASFQSEERPWTPASPQSRYSSDHPSLTPASTASIVLSDEPYYLRPDDTKPSYAPAGEISDEDFEPRLGCQHYKRNVKLQCFACKRWYPCRFCHDAAESHSLDRKKTENMLCMLCASPQPAAESCRKCGNLAAWYYCSVCKLWDDDNEKSIYHCNDCGICRIGQGLGKDFFHCKVLIYPILMLK